MSLKKSQQTPALSTTALFLAFLAASAQSPVSAHKNTVHVTPRADNKDYSRSKPEWFVRNDKHVRPKHTDTNKPHKQW